MGSEIQDCIIDGGYSFDVPCPADDETCWYGALPDASAWNPQTQLSLSSDTKRIEELFTAAEGQIHFTLTRFTYARGTGSLAVYKNGLLLKHGIDWVEQLPSMFSLAIPADADDQLIAVGYVAITANVDVRDTDIFVTNYQAIRDYGGTEVTLYAQGQATATDGGGAFFQYLSGAAPGTYVDDNINIIVPTGGDGSAAWISRTPALTFDTVADMKAHPSLKIGDFVSTDGYFNQFDDGGNVYAIVSAGTGVDDGGYFIDLPGSNTQARGLFPGSTYNVKQWGATGDGVTDDTTAIQNAHNILAFLGGAILVFNATANSYRCNITIQGNTSLKGVSKNTTLTPAIDAPIITLKADSNVSRVRIETLTFDGITNKATFTSQCGISSEPEAGRKHDTITIANCSIVDSGSCGISLYGGATTGNTDQRIEQVRIIDTDCSDNTGPGLHIKGNVGIVSTTSCEFTDNGDETVDALSNVVIEEDLPGIPEVFNFTSTKFDTAGYTATGNAVCIIGAVDITLFQCLFSDIFTGIKINLGTNGLIAVRDCRFERTVAGAIDYLADVEGVNGFIWDGNNVSANINAGVGLNINIFGTFTVKNISIGSNNSWGNLTTTTTDPIQIIVAATAASLISRHGLNYLSLAAPGTSNLDNVYDEKGGTGQLVSGDTIILAIFDAAKTITAKHGTGNLVLAGALDMALTNVNNTLMLMWNSRVSKWVEVSRSVNV